MAGESVDVRCPNNPSKLLSRLRLDGGKPTYVEGNLLEIACPDCKSNLRRRRAGVLLVLQHYNFLGELIETEVVWATPEKNPGR